VSYTVATEDELRRLVELVRKVADDPAVPYVTPRAVAKRARSKRDRELSQARRRD
jgi:hypothetical protein